MVERPDQETSTPWGVRIAIGSVVVIAIAVAVVSGRSNAPDAAPRSDAAQRVIESASTPSVAPAAPEVAWRDAASALVDAHGPTADDVPPYASAALADLVEGVRTQVTEERARARRTNASPDVLDGVTRLALVGALRPALDRIAENSGPDWPAQIDRYLHARGELVSGGGSYPSGELNVLRRQMFSPANMDRANAVEQMMEPFND